MKRAGKVTTALVSIAVTGDLTRQLQRSNGVRSLMGEGEVRVQGEEAETVIVDWKITVHPGSD